MLLENLALRVSRLLENNQPMFIYVLVLGNPMNDMQSPNFSNEHELTLVFVSFKKSNVKG